jgi:exodeoxyribonuclease V beta subunit
VTTPFDLLRAPLDPGTVLLEASAGTGKTYALVGVLLRLLLERRIERLEQAAVVTFTVAAADELKNRLYAALQTTLRAIDAPVDEPFFDELARRPGAGAILRQALAEFDRVGITTIHGFCKRLLAAAAFETREPFTVEFTPDPLPMLHRAAADALRRWYEPAVSTRAALLHDAGHTPASLVKAYRLWRRYPDVALAPDPPNLDAQLPALDAALAAAAAAFDDEAFASVAEIHWNKGKSPWAGDAPHAAELQAFRDRLRTTPALVLPLLEALAPVHHRGRILASYLAMGRLSGPFYRACDAVVAAATQAREHLRSSLLRELHARYEAEKQRARIWTFDDLLVRAHAALRDPDRRPAFLEAVRTRFTVGLIDEFQDTDPLQYEIFADCFAGRLLLLVGDPKQAIYGFRGADVGTYLAASRDASRRHTLLANHRSNATLVLATNVLFHGREDPFREPGIAFTDAVPARQPGELAILGDGDAVLRLRLLPATTSAAAKPDRLAAIVDDVVAEIARLMRSGARIEDRAVRPQDIAVLARRNLEAMAVQDRLRAHGIPSAIGKAGDIFASEEILELQRFLTAVVQPTDPRRVRAAMATRLWGLDAAALRALDEDSDAFDDALELLARWRRLWQRQGFIVMQERAFDDLDVAARLLAFHDGERRLTNLRQLAELLHAAEHTHRLSPEGLLAWLRHERQTQEELDYTLRELRLETDADAVQILTAHGSKGLQYEIVFCPFLWADLAPRPEEVLRRGDRHELVFGIKKGHPLRPLAAAQRLAEEVRLAYVALTRARRRCYVHVAAPEADDGPLACLFAGIEPIADRRRAALHALAAASGGAISTTEIALPATAERLELPPLPPLQPPRRPERRPRPAGFHSYSSLVAKSHDRDPIVLRDDAPLLVGERTPARRGMFAFARGPGPGHHLHALLEQIDLAQVDDPAVRDLVRASLDAAGLLLPTAHDGPIEPVDDVVAMLRDLAAATLPDGTTLAGLTAAGRRAEWGFVLPADNPGTAALAALFAASASAPARAQAPRLQALTPQALRGFLVGFVDVVAEHQGRFWILDWKSNHLGDHGEDYAPDRLLPAMVAHDYVLQYHLYLLALHRHLRARRQDYDYERHVGGVVYPFLRGVRAGSDRGLFVDRPPAALVHALDQWVDAGGRP